MTTKRLITFRALRKDCYCDTMMYGCTHSKNKGRTQQKGSKCNESNCPRWAKLEAVPVRKPKGKRGKK